jgi:SAM-dependent methyltransferase
MLQKLKSRALQESFHPGLLGVFINPYFFIRRGLYKRIREDAKSLEGMLLDFGCGRKPYKELFTVDKYLGVDVEQSGHSHELSEVDVYYDGKTLPFSDEYFDSVFCSEVFEHVFEIDLILREIYRVMKNKGKILITVPFAWIDHEIPYDFGRYSTYGIKYLLEKHGFEVIKISKSTNFVETVFQLWIVYLHETIRTRSKLVNAILNVILISPFTIIGILFSKIFVRRSDLYHNSIVLARKDCKRN